jgi:hypothetical protein
MKSKSARWGGKDARKMICIMDRSSTARNAVKLAQTAYTCLLLPTLSPGYGGHGAAAVKLAQTA